MTALYLGIILFGGSHLFSIFFPGARDGLKAKFGEKAWKGIYAILSLAGIVFLVIAYLGSRGGPLAADWVYVPAPWAKHATMLLVLLAFIALGASHGKGYLKTWLHNPMSIGIALWAAGHLLSNGKRTAVYMFGIFLVVALADIVMSELRGKRPSHEPRVKSDIIAVVAGIVLYAIFLLGFHPYVLNLPVVE
jgi:uncharacterized membrane protein